MPVQPAVGPRASSRSPLRGRCRWRPPRSPGVPAVQGTGFPPTYRPRRSPGIARSSPSWAGRRTPSPDTPRGMRHGRPDAAGPARGVEFDRIDGRVRSADLGQVLVRDHRLAVREGGPGRGLADLGTSDGRRECDEENRYPEMMPHEGQREKKDDAMRASRVAGIIWAESFMKHAPADPRGADGPRAPWRTGRRVDPGYGRWPGRHATPRGGARQDRGPPPSRPGPSRIRPGMGPCPECRGIGRAVGSTWDLGEGLRHAQESSPFQERPSSSVVDTGRKRITRLACNDPPRDVQQPGMDFGPAREASRRVLFRRGLADPSPWSTCAIRGVRPSRGAGGNGLRCDAMVS